MHEHAPPQIEAVETLVVTVGGSPTPVLLALAGLWPTHVVAVVSQASRPVWERCVDAAERLFGWSGSIEVVTVVDHDPVSMGEALAELEGAGLRDWSLAYAGGTPTMSAICVARWHAGPGSASPPGEAGPRAWYAAEAGDVLVSHDGVEVKQADVLGAATVPLHEMVALHGSHADAFDRAPQRWQPIVSAGDPAQLATTLRELPVYGASHNRDALEAALVQAVGEAVALVAADHPSTAVYRPVKASRPDGWELHDPRGLVVVSGLSVRVLTVAGFDRPWPDKPLLLRRQRVGDLKEQLFAAYDVARGVGGLHARAAVLGTDPSPSARDEVRPMWADVGPLTQPDDLPDREGDEDPPWPPMTAFAWDDLIEAVDWAGYPDDAHSSDLYRWLTEV